LSAFVELHIEQGRALVDLGAPVGLATAIWPHGRWRLSFEGEPNHAGTTRCEDRRDPVLPFAHTVIAARRAAQAMGARATLARVTVQPNATNAIAGRVEGWLDARAAGRADLERLVDDIAAEALRACEDERVHLALAGESFTDLVEFDPGLRRQVASVLGPVPEIPTAAGHDAGILARALPTAMLFVRNGTGTSHSPAEQATTDDCLAGVSALAAVLGRLASA
jgi:N-carbamoyl-L-amino-acid hydrolase